ncbi:hypothetical protein Trydic_g7205 [Trypoxylus dichotomus]
MIIEDSHVYLILLNNYDYRRLLLAPTTSRPRSTWQPARSSSSLPTKHPTGSFCTQGAAILASDLNTKHPSWNPRLTNASDTCLRRLADDFHLLVDATVEPTIFPHNGQPDVLDFTRRIP